MGIEKKEVVAYQAGREREGRELNVWETNITTLITGWVEIRGGGFFK